MTVFLLVVRIALAGIFVTAAAGKLLDREGARQAMRDFGVPGRLAPLAGILLPIAELAVAVALLPPLTGWFGAIGAVLLLATFSAAIALSIARGQAPDCNCFGQLGGGGPVGLRTLARNAGFAALAVIPIAAGPDQDGYRWVTDLSRLEQATLALGGVAIGLALLVLALVLLLVSRMLSYRRRIEALERDMPPPGLPVGDPAPAFALPAVSPLSVSPATSSGGPSSNGASAIAEDDESTVADGAAAGRGESNAEGTLDALRAPGLPVLLAFTSPTCAPCSEFYPELAEWQRDHADTFTTALIASGDPDANRERSGQHALANVLVQHGHEVANRYRTAGTPSAVLVSNDGTIAAPVARGADEIRNLTAALRTLSSMRGSAKQS